MPKPVFDKGEQCGDIKPAACRDIQKCKKEQTSLFGGKIETDDLILAAVAVMLLANDCDDKLLLLAIIFIFFTK